jgi:hypothetical protein
MANDGLLGVPMSFGVGDTLAGSLGAGLGAATPTMISPYASTGTAIGVGLGSILLQSLLGYQARQQAAERTLELNRLSTSLLGMKDAQERSDFIGTLGDTDPLVLGRLGSLSGALAAQDVLQQRTLDLERSKKMLGLDIELSPKAQKLADLEQGREIAKIKARNAGFGGQGVTTELTPEEIKLVESKEAWKSVPAAEKPKLTGGLGQAAILRELAQRFAALEMLAPEFQIAKGVPGSEADLASSQMRQMLPGIVRTLGDVGNIAIGEQKQILDSTMGSLLSGSESVAKRLVQLADYAESVVNQKMKNYSLASKYGIEGLVKAPTPTPAPTTAPAAETEANKAELLQKADQELAEIMQEINQLKAARGQ